MLFHDGFNSHSLMTTAIMYLLWWSVFSNLLPTFKNSDVCLITESWQLFTRSDKFYDRYVLQTFSLSVLSFHLFKGFCLKNRIFKILVKSNSSFFFFVICYVCILSNSLTIPWLKDFVQCFFLNVLTFTFRSVIIFNWSF